MSRKPLELENDTASAVMDGNGSESGSLALENPLSWDGNGKEAHAEDAFTRQILYALIAV